MIAGSVGKTSTKDAIAAVLSKKYSVRKSDKSFNSDIGVPLAILGLENAWGNPFIWAVNLIRGARAVFAKEFPKILVLEIGADHPGDIKQILQWIKPHLSVVTSFPDTPVHVEFFSSREALWEEDAEIIRALPKDGVVVTNADDRNIGQYLTRVSNPILTYGMHEACDVRGTSVRAYSDHGVVRGMEMDVVYRSERKTIRIPGILGDHLMYALLAGISVGIAEGVTYEDCISGVSESERPKGRMRIYEGLNHTTLIDDTYNASPVAVEAALKTVEHLPVVGRRIVVLGDMRELGGYSVTEHRKAGLLAGNVADIVIGVGESAKDLVESAKGRKASVVEWYAHASEAGKRVKDLLEKGDIVLVKGSQGVRMEKCAIELLANPEDAAYLPRQERAWQRR
jgi:UDP-N-acetylmuramoyl-tripeptide--D-alanyl-D-alanine ligase